MQSGDSQQRHTSSEASSFASLSGALLLGCLALGQVSEWGVSETTSETTPALRKVSQRTDFGISILAPFISLCQASYGELV